MKACALAMRAAANGLAAVACFLQEVELQQMRDEVQGVWNPSARGVGSDAAAMALACAAAMAPQFWDWRGMPGCVGARWRMLHVWCVVRGAWCVVRGAWCVVRFGPCAAARRTCK